MKELLPHYERELSFLRKGARDFAERYPKIASHLQVSGEACEDPHVGRMIESFALLSARVNKRLEDSYPEFAETLLNVVYPHYLRPFPSCSIVEFDRGEGESAAVQQGALIARGTRLNSRPVKGASCVFRTAWPLALTEVQVVDLSFDAAPAGWQHLQLPANGSAVLSLTLDGLSGEPPAEDGSVRLRFFIDAEPSVASALRDALFMRLIETHVECGALRQRVPDLAVEDVGFADDQALIDYPPNSHAAYRHLTEYFAFPEKYNFFDLVLKRTLCKSVSGKFTLHFVLARVQADSALARLLSTLRANNLRLRCVPVVNLFSVRGDPIRLTGRRSSYPVIADGRKAYAYEVHSIDSVRQVRQTEQGETVTEFRPFFALRHGEKPEENGNYWHFSRDPDVAQKSPGYETSISIVEANFDPQEAKIDVLSIGLTCSNRDLPTQLSIGLKEGDLSMECGSGLAIRFLRRPTPPQRFDHRRDGLWRLVSHLSLNQLSICASGLEAFREMLALYDHPGSALTRRQIAGVTAIARTPSTIWLAGRPFASFVRGVEVRISIDEDAFIGSGVDLFARVIDRFLSLYVHLNSFVQLVLVSDRSGEELIRCEPRHGASTLL